MGNGNGLCAQVTHPGMLSSPAPASARTLPKLASVRLHVYSISASSQFRNLNKFLRVLGTGAFHCGVEIHGREWSYEGGGIFCLWPRSWQEDSYFDTIELGNVTISDSGVLRILGQLESAEWSGHKYDILEHNCCHFCEAFCLALGVEAVPEWVTSLAAEALGVRNSVDFLNGCMRKGCCYHSRASSVRNARRVGSEAETFSRICPESEVGIPSLAQTNNYPTLLSPQKHSIADAQEHAHAVGIRPEVHRQSARAACFTDKDSAPCFA